MKHAKKALLVLSFILAASFIFAAGQQEGSTESSETGPQTITCWMPGQEATIRSTYEGIIEAYEKENPNITVEYVQVPWGEWFTKLSTAIAGNMVPDVSGLGYGQFGMMCTKDVLAEIPDDPKFKLEDVQEWALKSGQYKGKQYALFLPSTYPFGYRIDHFEEAGLDPDKPPRDWDQLTDYAVKLTERTGSDVTRAGIDIPYIGFGEQIYLVFYAQKKKNAQLWEEGGKPVFYNQEGIDTLKYLSDLRIEHDVVVPSNQQSLQGAAFEAGVASMGFPKSIGLPTLIKSKPGQVGLTTPTKEVDSRALTLGTFLSVYKNAKNQEGGFDFLAHLYSEESMWAIYKGILFHPTRNSLWDKFLEDAPYNKALAECMQISVNYNIHPEFGQARQIVADAVEEAFFETKTPEQALKDAHEKMLELLE